MNIEQDPDTLRRLAAELMIFEHTASSMPTGLGIIVNVIKESFPQSTRRLQTAIDHLRHAVALIDEVKETLLTQASQVESHEQTEKENHAGRD